MIDDLLSAQQLAQLLGCSEEVVELETRQGRLPGLKLGRCWRFPREALLQVLNQRALDEMTARLNRPGDVTPQARRGRQIPPPLPVPLNAGHPPKPKR